MNTYYVVSTSLESGRDNIFIYKKNDDKAMPVMAFDGGTRPSYHLFDAANSLLYLVNEKNREMFGESGTIRTYKISISSQSYELIGEVDSQGDDPCFLTKDPKGHFLMCANYSGSGIAVFRLKEDGSPSETIQHFHWEGSGPNKQRQEKPHPHSLCFSPEGAYCFVPDLGCDLIRVFEFDSNKEVPLSERDDLNIYTKPGSGPRMMAFIPGKNQAWLVNELDSTAILFDYKKGQLLKQKTINLLENQDTENISAHIQCRDSWVYISNRGVNNVVKIDDGEITSLPGTGSWPRYFHIPDNEMELLLGWQQSNRIDLYHIGSSGDLLFRSEFIDVPQPSCISSFKTSQ